MSARSSARSNRRRAVRRASAERGDRDHLVGNDVGAVINLARIDVNVLVLIGLALNRGFTVVVVKLFDEVLLTVEVSDLRRETDLAGGVSALTFTGCLIKDLTQP